MGRREKLLVALLALSLSANALFFALPLAASVESAHRLQHVLQLALHYVEMHYVEPLSEEQLLTGAVRGVLAATSDPYTRFLDREEHEAFFGAERGRRVGIGVEVTIQDGVPVVISPLEGGAAARAGVMAQDRIVSIDGLRTENVAFGELLKRIGGELGTVVTIEVERSGEDKPIEFQITRAHFDLEYVRSEILSSAAQQFGYLRLTHFFGDDQGTTEDFRAALRDFEEKKVRGVVVDLRNNSGGHLNMAVDLAAAFLGSNQLVVVSRGRAGEVVEEHRTMVNNRPLLAESTAVIVLINKGSASASEILAGALQDHGRARLLGAQSFGKGSVQQIFRPLPGDTAVLITTQRYYTPKNRSIHEVGLTPDINEERGPKLFSSKVDLSGDPQLRRALEELSR